MPTDSIPNLYSPLDSGKAAPHQAKPRLHFMDWLRTLMVWGVVFAHVDRTIGSLSNGNGEWIVDDHVLGGAGEQDILMRTVSVARQWCLPLLFWVSGAAAMLSWKGAPKGFDKIGLLTVVGLGANAALWWLSPRDPDCSPQEPCVGKGVLFDFSTVYASGFVFPYVFQMWYTIALMFYMLLNWPLCLAVSLEGQDVGQVKRLAPQWAATVLFSSVLIWMAGETCAYPLFCVVWIAVTEAAFLGIASLASPARHFKRENIRQVHYALAAVTVLQFAVTPFSSEAATLGPSFAAFSLVGFNRFFGLGVVMMQGRSRGLDVPPLISRYWPVMLIVLALLAPSTNWLYAGNLTYPFFTQTLDRVLYVSGAVAVIYSIDRCSRWSGTECEQCPAFVNTGSVLLYLFHPITMTVLISINISDSATIWLLSSAWFFAIAFVLSRGGKKKVSARTIQTDSNASAAASQVGVVTDLPK